MEAVDPGWLPAFLSAARGCSSGEDVQRIGFDEGAVFAESYAYVSKRGLSVRQGLRREEGVAVLRLYAQRGGPIY